MFNWFDFGWHMEFLQSPKDENVELEDVGDLYIKKLLLRSFFQDVDQEYI